MKRYVFLVLIFLFLIQLISFPCFAYNVRYLVYTSSKDIDYKKNKALKWYENNTDKKKFYFYDMNKHIDWLKNRALKWYSNNHEKGKFYLVHADVEREFCKKKALRWYDKNSK